MIVTKKIKKDKVNNSIVRYYNMHRHKTVHTFIPKSHKVLKKTKKASYVLDQQKVLETIKAMNNIKKEHKNSTSTHHTKRNSGEQKQDHYQKNNDHKEKETKYLEWEDYGLLFVGGMYATYYVRQELEKIFQEDGVDATIINKIYPIVRSSLIENFALDKYCQEVFNIKFSEFEEIFEQKMGYSVKDLIIFMSQEKMYARSFEEVLFLFQHKLKNDEGFKKRFLNFASALVYPTVNKKAPSFCEKLGLLDNISYGWAESWYNFLVSSEFNLFIDKISDAKQQDQQNFSETAKSGVHAAGSILFGITSNIMVESVLERGVLRTFLLTPAIILPPALLMYNRENYYVDFAMKRLGRWCLNHPKEIMKFCANYQLDNLDASQSILEEDLSFNVVIDRYKDNAQFLKENIKTRYLPLLEDVKNKVEYKESDNKRLLKAMTKKIFAN